MVHPPTTFHRELSEILCQTNRHTNTTYYYQGLLAEVETLPQILPEKITTPGVFSLVVGIINRLLVNTS